VTTDQRGSAGGNILLSALSKSFGSFHAVDRLDLGIAAGEFFSLLGPSGCGKTTTLRMIAGFEVPTSGQILLDGTDMVAVPPHRRDVRTVFQSYALFPHMTVFDNVAFGLRRAKTGRAEIRSRVGEALEMVQLSGLARRKTTTMSGGQQQRVALARALVCKPAVLLLDEPLGALDAKLRKALQLELKQLQELVGITFVYVTHDQDEALTMSDRIAVMNSGHLEQVAAPAEIYDRPETAFVAEFLGASNLMTVQRRPGDEQRGIVRLGDHQLEVTDSSGRRADGNRIVIRPERARLDAAGATGPNRLPGTVIRTVFHGFSTQVLVRLPTGDTLDVLLQNTGEQPVLPAGAPVTVWLPAESLRVLRDTGVPVPEHEVAVPA